MARLNYISCKETGDGDTHEYHFTCGCSQCDKTKVITVKGFDLFRYHNGIGYLQEIFHYLPPGDREQLFQSGICNECFDRIFAEDDDPEDDPEVHRQILEDGS